MTERPIFCSGFAVGCSILTLLFALPFYFMGCSRTLGGNCGGYTPRMVTIKSNDLCSDESLCLYGIWNVSGGDTFECEIQTQHRCSLTPNRCLRKFRRWYPVGSELKVFTTTSDDICRTPQFLNNLATVGFAFFCLLGLLWAGAALRFCCDSCRHTSSEGAVAPQTGEVEPQATVGFDFGFEEDKAPSCPRSAEAYVVVHDADLAIAVPV